MGGLLSSNLRSALDAIQLALGGREKAKIIILGLDAAGKTSILYRMMYGEAVATQATVGFNVETVSHGNVDFTVWDVGGQQKIRNLWGHYLLNVQALVFVVDSADRSRLAEATEELHRIAALPGLKGAPIVVVANKQDMPNALPASDIATLMRLPLLYGHRWHVQPAVAQTGEGVAETFEQVATLLRRIKQSVAARAQ
jgi:ADP-ribosylation factor protein 1